MHRWLLVCPLTLASSLLGQAPALPDPPGIAPGLRTELLFEERANPFAFHGYAAGLEPGELYVAVARQVLRLANDAPTELIHEFLPGNNAGLLMRPTGDEDLFYSDFRNSILYQRDLRSGHEVQLRLPNFTFDIAVSPDGDVFASANPNFLRPGARSGIYRVRGDGAPPEKLIDFDGPSGPIVFDAHGYLYYATQSDSFPTPPGSVRVLRFGQFRSPRALRSDPPHPISENLPSMRGVEVVASLDGAFDLGFDDRDRLYISDPNEGGVRRSLERSFELDRVPLLAASGHFTTQLQYVRAPRGDFAAYQPDLGPRLLVAITTADAARVWSISPARPQLASVNGPSTGPGTLSLAVSGLPARQAVFLLASAAPARPEIVLQRFAGLPLWFGLDPTARLLSWQGETDAEGRHRFDIAYAGGLDLEINFQALGLIRLPPFADFLASTPAVAIHLHP